MGADASKDQIWRYLGQYVEGANADAYPELDRLIDNAMAYNRDYVAPTLNRRKPQGGEGAALKALDDRLAALPADAPADDIQNIVYEIGKDEAYGFENLRDWFKALYETLLGSSAGPRMGSFIALFGIANTRRLIAEALS
jgi:lysyl-tRNA synthetase class 1